ncbi:MULTISPECIES: PAS domain S-box protein [Methylorubrum]|uniref:PAS domain S-box protein n=1 Tax=Methylorubrum TaxID=2282523 RepID=UPI00209D7BDC|nr:MULTISPECIES: PAS domain S-box protein [Methylorubrum]MCP1549735.1 PAS domain S-box-containing protein [Methylorubrum zatmanii]MCP1553651.1 PAS domain S-box-containing protein [Methylorubrum extorquens]MCP1580037.1 PAS domain S-box-containing protein [Methylorubrum extorquens]
MSRPPDDCPASGEAGVQAERLAALARYDILDTPAEVAFDDAVALAAQLCATPTALVSLVTDDRQWFKARLGFTPGETGLDRSVCVHALAQGGLLVIPDLAADPRTCANPLVTGEPGIRFYAGASLTTPEDVAIGTLCVLDTVPRPEGLSAAQAAGLEALARTVMTQLELRRGIAARKIEAAALADSEFRLRLAIEAAGAGIFDYDLVTGTLDWDGRTRALFGVGPDEAVSYAGTFLARLHPEDRARTDAAVQAALDPAGPGLLDATYRTVSGDGRLCAWVAARGTLVVEGGRARRFVGTVRDVTAERMAQVAVAATEERYRLVTRATNDAIWDWDLVADHVLWNEALQAAYGWAPEAVEPTGRWWLDHVHAEDRARVEAGIRRVIGGGGHEWHHEYRFRRADGAYADVLDRGSMVRGADGTPLRMIGAMLDLTERNRVAAQLRAVVEGANVGIVQIDPRTMVALEANAKLCAIWGAEEADIVGHSVAKWTPEAEAAERDRLHRRLAAGEIVRETLEKRYRRKDGRLIWARVNLVSQARGEAFQATAMIEDITAEKAAEARQTALIELGDTLRDAASPAEIGGIAAQILRRTLDLSDAGYATIDATVGGFAIGQERPDGTVSPAPFPAMLARLRRGEILAVPDLAAEPNLAPDAGGYAAAGARALVGVPLTRRGDLVGLVYAHAAKPRAWDAGEVDFVREVAGRISVALARIQAEEQQRFLNRELSHRLKNTLTMAQAIASQTLRNATDIASVKDALVARLVALGKAHDILLSGEGEGAALAAVIAGALTIHDDGEPGRIHLSGPALDVGPKAALSLALMIHELATNAAKYGAFSVPGGRVGVDWSVARARWPEDAREIQPVVTLTWTETGGPPVAAPTRKGFGSRLIERGFSGAVGGETQMIYAREGVTCLIRAPLKGLLEKE